MRDDELGSIYNDGEIVCSEGDEGKTMYVIQSGKVNVVKKMRSKEVVLTTLGEGDFFGEMSLFNHLPRSATVKAAGEARVLSIDKEKFFMRTAEDPSFAFRLMEGMSRRIRILDDELNAYRNDRSGPQGL